MTVAQARREYGVTGSQTINGWLRKYAPDYRGARAAQGKKAGAKKGAVKAAAKKGRASGKKAGRGRPATRGRR
jgi:transposase-like protein